MSPFIIALAGASTGMVSMVTFVVLRLFTDISEPRIAYGSLLAGWVVTMAWLILAIATEPGGAP